MHCNRQIIANDNIPRHLLPWLLIQGDLCERRNRNRNRTKHNAQPEGWALWCSKGAWR